MKTSRTHLILICVLSLVFLSFHQILTGQGPLRPLRTEVPPIIDGKMDDAVWQQAPFVSDFKTFAPDYGREGSERTVAYMAYDRENLYFAFRCLDREPGKIKTAVTSRDNIRPDDWVCINLDTFNDHQSLYAFYVNPAGIQMDSRYAAGREDLDADFVWYSAGHLKPEGYTVEICIPLRSIRYTATSPVTMSIFFERYISRFSEHDAYPELDPAKGYNFLTQMTPLLYDDLEQHTLFELLPAATYSRKYEHDAGKLVVNERRRDLSLTAKYGLASDLVLDGTYNPDFSQIEADAGQVDVNLRYALYFPEKRPFFIEGNEIYNLAATQASNVDPMVSIVHTRTIANPLVGIKLSGKIDANNTIASLYAMDEMPSEESALHGNYAHIPILRYKRSLTEDSYLGGIYAGREMKNHFNRMAGVDGMLRVTQASMLEFNGLYSRTRPEATSVQSSGHALSLAYSYGTRDFDYAVSFKNISTDFAAETGFIDRTGILSFTGLALPKFYPQSGIVQKIAGEVFSAQTQDKFSNLWETFNHLSVQVNFLRTLFAVAKYSYSTEIFANERFKTGGFHFLLQGQWTKQLSLSLLYRRVNAIYYSTTPDQGRSNHLSASMVYQPTQKIESSFDFVFSDFHRASDSKKIYEYPITRAKLTYQMNRYLFFRGIAEYNKFRRQLLTDFLASFTYIPGTVAHLGYGSLYQKRQWNNSGYVESDRLLEMKRGFFFKVSYLWRL